MLLLRLFFVCHNYVQANYKSAVTNDAGVS